MGAGQFVEQHRELAVHAGVADEGAIGLLHHGGGFGGAGERDMGDVRARGGAADDVDVLVARAGRQGVGRGRDLAGCVQVVDVADVQAVQRDQVRSGRVRALER